MESHRSPRGMAGNALIPSQDCTQDRPQGSSSQIASHGVRTLVQQLSRSADDLKQSFRHVRAIVEGGTSSRVPHACAHGSAPIAGSDSVGGVRPDRSSSTAMVQMDRHAPFMHDHGSSNSTPVGTPPRSHRTSVDVSSPGCSGGLVDSPVGVHEVQESATPEPPGPVKATKTTVELRENPARSLDLRAFSLQRHQDVPTPKLGSSRPQKSTHACDVVAVHQQSASKHAQRSAVPPLLPSGRLSPPLALHKVHQKDQSACVHDLSESPASVSAPLPAGATDDSTTRHFRHYFRVPLPHPGVAQKRTAGSQGVCEGTQRGHRDDITSVCSSMHVGSPSDSDTPSDTSHGCMVLQHKSRSLGAVCESDTHEKDVYRSDSYRGMHMVSRHRYLTGASSGVSSRQDVASVHSMRSSGSADIMHDVIMAPVLVRGPNSDTLNIPHSSDMPLSDEEVAEWGRQTSGLSDVFTMPAGNPVLAPGGHRYPSGNASSTPCSLSRATSALSISSAVYQQQAADPACMACMHAEERAAHSVPRGRPRARGDVHTGRRPPAQGHHQPPGSSTGAHVAAAPG